MPVLNDTIRVHTKDMPPGQSRSAFQLLYPLDTPLKLNRNDRSAGYVFLHVKLQDLEQAVVG